MVLKSQCRRVIEQKQVLEWLTEFQRCVRAYDYDAAEKLFHSCVVAFGTRTNHADSIAALRKHQWEMQWPSNLEFTFYPEKAAVLRGLDQVVICLPWASKSIIHRAPKRIGRATIVLGVFEEGKLLALHTHFSLAV